MTVIENALLESMKMNQFLSNMHEEFAFIDILTDTNPQKGDTDHAC